MTNVASALLQMDRELCRLLKQYVKDFRPDLCSPDSKNDFLFLVGSSAVNFLI